MKNCLKIVIAGSGAMVIAGLLGLARGDGADSQPATQATQPDSQPATQPPAYPSMHMQQPNEDISGIRR